MSRRSGCEAASAAKTSRACPKSYWPIRPTPRLFSLIRSADGARSRQPARQSAPMETAKRVGSREAPRRGRKGPRGLVRPRTTARVMRNIVVARRRFGNRGPVSAAPCRAPRLASGLASRRSAKERRSRLEIAFDTIAIGHRSSCRHLSPADPIHSDRASTSTSPSRAVRIADCLRVGEHRSGHASPPGARPTPIDAFSVVNHILTTF